MNLERMEELLFYRNILETDFVQDLRDDAPYSALSRLFQNYSTMPKETNLWHIFLEAGKVSPIRSSFKERWKSSIPSTI